MTKHILISGGSRGLGSVIVTELLEAGYNVSTFSRRPTTFVEESTVKHCDQFAFFPGDLGDATSIKSVVNQVIERFGPPFGLINNAAIAIDGVLATMDETSISRLLCINLEGTLLLTRRIVRQMLTRRSGRILNLSSIIGIRGYRGLAVYAATKAGLDGITRALARELGPRRITVNSVAPGYLETDMTHGLGDTQRAQIVKRTPLGRLGTPEDVTGIIHFLLSDAAEFITGQTIVVDGGITC